MKDKLILDACCGGRTFWFDKHHPNALYIDNRKTGKGIVADRPNFEVAPDIQMDFRDLDFKDKTFKLVVFDPPHFKSQSEKSWLAKKYGKLGKTWQSDLRKGFKECWRVLDDYGTLIFKWNAYEISIKEVLKCFDQEPLFGHPTNRQGTTKWMAFLKIPQKEQEVEKCSCAEYCMHAEDAEPVPCKSPNCIHAK